MKQQPNQTSLFEAKLPKERHGLPVIYRYENLPINKKINYKIAPHFKYGSKHNTTIDNCYNEPVFNRYGLNRKGLDYSLQPND